MIVDVLMPKMGESITEGTILEWYKKVGDVIEEDETLLEIGTDKVDSEIPSPSAGVISELLANPNDVVDVGKVIARINTDENNELLDKAENKEDNPIIEKEDTVIEKPSPTLSSDLTEKNQKKVIVKKPVTTNSAIFTPVVMKIVSQEGISLSELELIDGSGANGRITKKDLQTYINSRSSSKSRPIKICFGELNAWAC